MPSWIGYSVRMKHDERDTVKRNAAVKDRADGVGAMSGRAWRLRVECFFLSFFPNILNKVQFFFILTFSTIPKINRKSKTSRGSLRNRNCIWEVRSKASTPEMTKKPLKAFLHRKAAKIRRFFETALTRIESSGIFDLDESASFNYFVSKHSKNFLPFEVANIKQTDFNFSSLSVIC